jgi:hypothetical protein
MVRCIEQTLRAGKRIAKKKGKEERLPTEIDGI